jgi:hypothetical protein
MVEIFFGIITRQAIRRGTHRSVRELVEAIGRFIDKWNDRCEPFVWTKTADEILTHAAQVQEPPSRDASPMGNQVKAAKTQAWRLQVAPARH